MSPVDGIYRGIWGKGVRHEQELLEPWFTGTRLNERADGS
jgi:hypothetical protein